MAGYDGDQHESIKSLSVRESFGLSDYARVTGKPEVTELLPVCDDPSRIHAGFPERHFWTMRRACPVT